MTTQLFLYITLCQAVYKQDGKVALHYKELTTQIIRQEYK